jgi:hypothetical protein
MNRPKNAISPRGGIALVAASLLWSEAAVWSAIEGSQDRGFMEFSLADLVAVLVACAIPAFLFALFYFRERWSLVAVVLLLLGPVRCSRIDYNQVAKERWEVKRSALEAKLPTAIRLKVPAPDNSDYSVSELNRDVRVVIDAKGHRWVSFIQVRGFIDNGMAYVYDPQDSLTVEVGKVESPPCPGWYLSGFGIIGEIQPLGGHWYRVQFT